MLYQQMKASYDTMKKMKSYTITYTQFVFRTLCGTGASAGSKEHKP